MCGLLERGPFFVASMLSVVPCSHLVFVSLMKRGLLIRQWRNHYIVDAHHDGHFVDMNKTKCHGFHSKWKCDPDRWIYLEVLEIIEGNGLP